MDKTLENQKRESRSLWWVYFAFLLVFNIFFTIIPSVVAIMYALVEPNSAGLGYLLGLVMLVQIIGLVVAFINVVSSLLYIFTAPLKVSGKVYGYSVIGVSLLYMALTPLFIFRYLGI